MARCTFKRGFVASRLAEGRTSICGKVRGAEAVMEFEASLPHAEMEKLCMFMVQVLTGAKSPQVAFAEAYGVPPAPAEK